MASDRMVMARRLGGALCCAVFLGAGSFAAHEVEIHEKLTDEAVAYLGTRKDPA